MEPVLATSDNGQWTKDLSDFSLSQTGRVGGVAVWHCTLPSLVCPVRGKGGLLVSEFCISSSVFHSANAIAIPSSQSGCGLQAYLFCASICRQGRERGIMTTKWNGPDFPGAYSGKVRSWERKKREEIGLLPDKHGFSPGIVLGDKPAEGSSKSSISGLDIKALPKANICL